MQSTNSYQPPLTDTHFRAVWLGAVAEYPSSTPFDGNTVSLRTSDRGSHELTETYSPAAMDIAPATRPATPAIKGPELSVVAVATPMIKLAVETIPSLAPSTAARSRPIRETTCESE